jgi:hypothetical protein
VSSALDRRLIVVVLVLLGMMLACTTPPPSPATKDGPAAKPAAASPSPSPVAQVSPTAVPPRQPVVGGGAAQPIAKPTFQGIGGSAIVVVPTPNLAANPTPVRAPLAPGVALTTPQPANIPQVTGTLSRIPTAIPGAGGGGGGAGAAVAAAAAVAAGGGGGGGSQIQTIPAVLTATPPVRINPQPQPAVQFPGR